MYVIVDPEVGQNGSLAMESLLEQESAEAVTSVLDERFVERRVFFPTFTRYFLAKEQSFKRMIEDLLKPGKTGRNDNAPLVLKDDVLRWKNIANRRIAYLGDTYRLFKDTVSKTEKKIITLMRVHMKMCIRQYQALIPQLDLIATQWGVSIEDILSQIDFGLPKSERKGRKRQSNQEDTEHTDHARPRQKPFVETDALVTGPSAGSSQQEETLTAAV
jgi:hypothetical protein